MKKINTAMALRWLIFLPFILLMCIVVGAIQGVYFMLQKVGNTMWKDLEMGSRQ